MSMGYGESTSLLLEEIASAIVDSAFRVHSTLGPGLLESVYEACMEHELKSRGFLVARQVHLPVHYHGVELDGGLRLDLLVNGRVIVEIKAVDQMNPVYEAQVITYLKLTGHPLAFLINFNVPLIKKGIKRVILSSNQTQH